MGGRGGGQGCVVGTSGPLTTNGGVTASVVGPDGTIYIGGSFTQIGPATGGAVPFDLASGQPAASFPKVAGSVSGIVPDGAGGVYLGGLFTHVGGLPRGNLAHVLAGGTVDPTFAPTVSGSSVTAVTTLALGSGVLYLGGAFTSVAGQGRNNVAAVDLSGAVTAWNPNVGGTTAWAVSALALRGDTIYLGGVFSTVAGQSRKLLAAVDKTGALLPWSPSVNGPAVVTMAAGEDGVLYVGGTFKDIDGQERQQVAAFDSAGNLTAWAPTFVGSGYSRVAVLTVSGTTVYASGDFSLVNGVSRNRLAAVDTSGALLPFAPTLEGSVDSIAVAGNRLLLAGSIGAATGQPRGLFVTVDATGTSSHPERSDRWVSHRGRGLRRRRLPGGSLQHHRGSDARWPGCARQERESHQLGAGADRQRRERDGLRGWADLHRRFI